MSERNEIAVVLIVAIFVGTLIERITALKMIAGMALLLVLQNQSAVFDGTWKLFTLGLGGLPVREYRGDLQQIGRSSDRTAPVSIVRPESRGGSTDGKQ